MKRIMNEWDAQLQKSMRKANIDTLVELYELTGINEMTFTRRRAHPSGWKLYELNALRKAMGMSDEDFLLLVKGG